MSVSEKFNLANIAKAEDFVAISANDIGDRKYRLMLTGYSAAPEGYAENAHKFVSDLVEQLGGKNTALITSPTADKGSIDAIGTLVAQSSGAKIMYITSEEYSAYIDPDKFPDTLDKDAYTDHKKYVLPDNATYSVASTVASNAILVTGGRDTAVVDTVNSILRGNAVVVAEGLTTTPAWDDVKNRVNNAAAYMRAQIDSLNETGALKYEVRGGLTEGFLNEHKDKFAFVAKPEDALVALVRHQNTPSSLPSADNEHY